MWKCSLFSKLIHWIRMFIIENLYIENQLLIVLMLGGLWGRGGCAGGRMCPPFLDSNMISSLRASISWACSCTSCINLCLSRRSAFLAPVYSWPCRIKFSYLQFGLIKCLKVPDIQITCHLNVLHMAYISFSAFGKLGPLCLIKFIAKCASLLVNSELTEGPLNKMI